MTDVSTLNAGSWLNEIWFRLCGLLQLFEVPLEMGFAIASTFHKLLSLHVVEVRTMNLDELVMLSRHGSYDRTPTRLKPLKLNG